MSDVKDAEDRPPRRTYSSPKRVQAALETRRRIRAAAERLFLRDGYAHTAMIKIAAEAGVAEKTVYLAYPSKADLLNEIIRVGVRGDDDEQELSHRTLWLAMLASESVQELLARFANVSAEMMARSGHVIALAEGCAVSDARLAELRDQAHAHIRSDMREVAAELDARGALATGLDPERASAILFAFVANDSPYLRLTDECNWTPDEYAELIHALLSALLTAPQAEDGKI
jgi:AcrR family transcriptional regulator